MYILLLTPANLIFATCLGFMILFHILSARGQGCHSGIYSTSLDKYVFFECVIKLLLYVVTGVDT